MSKFNAMNESGMRGTEYGIATRDIVETLERWDVHYGLDILDVARDRLCVGFRWLPDNLTRLADEIYGICPSVMAEHAATLTETMAVMDGAGLGDLTRGAEFEEELGLELLEETLREKQAVTLCWH